MAGETKIEWADRTWNPIVGCSILSPGCKICYAMRMAARLAAMSVAHETANAGDPGPLAHYRDTTQPSRAGAEWTGKIGIAPQSTFLAPLRWTRPRRIFVNSMSDLFHDDVPDDIIDLVFAIMTLAPQHTFKVLTKRSRRMRDYMRTEHRKRMIAEKVMQVSNMLAREAGSFKARVKLDHFSACFAGNAPPPNVWLGVSTEDQTRYDERKPDLDETPAAVRFISAEPLLGPIDGGPGIASLDWVIVGGESGKGARPMLPDWARDLRDECAAAGVPFHFKQYGEWAPGEVGVRGGTLDTATYFADAWQYGRQTERVSMETHTEDEPDVYRVGKKAAGRLLDGVLHDDEPAAAPARIAA
jgi:protein gp37